MELTTNYILSQIFSVLCYICYGITYFSKSQKRIRLLGIIMNVFLAISYLFLSAWSGFFMLSVAVLRNIIFFYQSDNKNVKKDIIFLIFINVIIVAFGIISYKDIFSLLPIFAMLIFTYALWQKKTIVYKALGVPGCAMWITYNIYVKSVVSATFEGIMMIIALIGYLKERKEINKTKLNSKPDINLKN